MDEEKDLKIYEIGFHLIPTISAEAVGAEFSKVKSVIEEKGGSFLSEEFPKLRPLAYTISKGGRGSKEKYDQAYFSWIKFQAEPSAAPEIKKAVDLIETVLRFIIIKTVRENIMFTPRPTRFRTADPDRIARRNKEEKEKAEKPISEAELDKTIEELVVQ